MTAIRCALLLLLTRCRQTKADRNRSRHLTSDDFTRGGAIVHYILPWWHPEIQSVAKNQIPGPSDHPLLDDDTEFQQFIRANTDESHRFFDGRKGYIQRPDGLPRGHPNCDNYFIYQEIPVSDLLTVYFDHPDIHEAYLNGERFPGGHPSASGLLQKVLPNGHPDVDDLFFVHEELPGWHPDLSLLLNDNPIEIETIHVFSGHPDLNDETGEPVDDHPTVNHLFEAQLPDSHPNIDDLMKEWYTLPSWHPKLGSIVVPRPPEEIPVDDLPTVYFDHPDIHEAYLNRERLPEGHPSASGLLQKVLPNGHPDVDDLFFDHEELPGWHLDLSLLLNDNPIEIETIHVFSGHPNLNDETGEPVDDHPTVHHLFEAQLPDSHPNIDDLMQEGYTLPSWHPKLGSIVVPRPFVTSPGSIFNLIVAALLLVFMLSRNVTKLRNSKRTMEVILAKNDAPEETSSSSDDVTGSQEGGTEIVMHRHHHGNDINPHEDRVLVYKEIRSNWKKAFGKRVMKSSNSTGEVVICLLYVLINFVALWISPDYSFGVGFGSLSAGNTVFTFITAARNSFLTWFIGVVFDQVLLYHHFIGRLTVIFALVQSCFYANDVIEKTTEFVTITGLISLVFGVVIMLSSVNYVRRKFFNLFFWSHCASFIGLLVGMYLHAPAARPFILAAIGCYGLDKGLQMLWKMPRRTALFQKVDERTAHVRFAKAPLSSILRKHRVGQYVFVNFPSLSLQEWHPFSVASGPSDTFIDVYIRALGDHTEKIVEYSEQCAAQNKQVRIHVDGPYGTLPFNYRRYGSILFVGGGISITPILGVLKDIYASVGRESKKKTPSHCIKNVSVVWIMPHAAESSLFLDVLNSFHLKSLEDPLKPELKLSIHVTRDSDPMVMGQQIVYSKPRSNAVMGECIENKAESQTSMLVYACGPGGLVKRLWDASMKKKSKALRVDFYHEKFEF